MLKRRIKYKEEVDEESVTSTTIMEQDIINDYDTEKDIDIFIT